MKILIFFLILISSIPSIYAGNIDNDFRESQKAIFDLAIDFVGQNKYSNKSITDSLISQKVLLKSNYSEYPPFIRNKTSGKSVWIVELDSVDLRPEKSIAKGVEDEFRSDLRVIIDSSTNVLVRIYSLPENCLDEVALFPTAEEQEKHFSSYGVMYHGLYNGSPKVKFIEAIRASSECRAFTACQISAELVYYSYEFRGGNVIPVWIIQTKGIPRGYMFGGEPGISRGVSQKPNCRGVCVIDAETGRVVSTRVTSQ